MLEIELLFLFQYKNYTYYPKRHFCKYSMNLLTCDLLFLRCWRFSNLFILCLVTLRRSLGGPKSDAADSEFPGQHFQSDLLILALGSSQRDLFEDDWLDVMVRVYWLKARFLALQVKFIFSGLLSETFSTQLNLM